MGALLAIHAKDLLDQSTLLAADSFNRSNGVPGSTDGKGSSDPAGWTSYGSLTWSVSSNAMGVSGGSTHGFLAVDVGTPNQVVTARIPTLPNSGRQTGICARLADVNNYIAFEVYNLSGTYSYLCYTNIAGSIAFVTGTPVGTPSAGVVLSIECVGTTITFKANGVTVLVSTVSSLTSNTKAGLSTFAPDSATLYDDFTVKRPAKQTFSDDWASGDNSKWATITGSPTVSGTYGRSGNGVRINPAAAAKYLGTSTGKWAQTYAYASFSVWLYFATLPTATHGAQILTVANTNNVQNFDTYIEATTGKLHIDLVNADAYNTGVSVTSGVWHNMQGRIFFGGSTTTARILWDGAEYAMQSTGQTASSVRSVILGDTGTSDSFDMWADDFRITVADLDPGWIT